jgi:hypothetical protein
LAHRFKRLPVFLGRLRYGSLRSPPLRRPRKINLQKGFYTPMRFQTICILSPNFKILRELAPLYYVAFSPQRKKTAP